MFRSVGGRLTVGVLIIIFLIALLHNEETASTALLPYLPVSPSRGTSASPAARLAVLRDRMALSEKAWLKSVEGRHEMAEQHENYPKVPFFPMDFMSYPYTIWDFFPPTWACPHDIQRVGRMGDGGKWVCGMSLYENVPAPVFPTTKTQEDNPDPSSVKSDDGIVVYSFGINDESSFEAELLERVPSARIWGYDFSVNRWGGQIPQSERHRTFFKKVGLGKEDKHRDSPAFWTLPSLMAYNNHTYIDILKVDVEGSEYDSLDKMMDTFENVRTASGDGVLPVGQVLIELHLGDGIHTNKNVGGAGVDYTRFSTWWERLEKMGMRPAYMEINLFAVTLPHEKTDPRCTEYVWVNARDEKSLLWK